MNGLTIPGVHSILGRLHITWKRARSAIRSPDPNYLGKLADVNEILALARASAGRMVVLYLDEVTVERQPTLAAAYARQGHDQARAVRSHSANTQTRIIATLDAQTGQVVFQIASKTTLAILVEFYQAVHRAYPNAERIYVIQDNWPVHTHPDVLIALEPQLTRWDWHRPSRWPTTPSEQARRRWSQLNLPIQIVPLPTYASWCNPIEKLWRKLRQDVAHLHPWANDLPRLREELRHFLQQFASRSETLLRYVGIPN